MKTVEEVSDFQTERLSKGNKLDEKSALIQLIDNFIFRIYVQKRLQRAL